MEGRTSLHRWLLSAGAVVAASALLAVIALGFFRAEPGGEWSDGPAPVVEPLPAPPVVLAAGDAAAPAPTAAGIAAAIDDLIGSGGLGDRVSVQVTDVLTGESLYARRTDEPAVPASTIKIATSVAALTALGPAHQIPTTAVAGLEPGEVVLVGGGDPTLAVDEDGTYRGAARLDALAAQVRESLGDARVDRVTVDAGVFTGPVDGPWTSDIPGSGYVGPITGLMTDGGRVDPSKIDTPTAHHAEPDLAAGRAFAELLDAPRESVERGGRPPASSPAPAGGSWVPGAELGRVLSPPLLRLVDIVLTDSDNTVSEALARQVALARGEPASFAGAGTAVSEVLAELGAPVAGAVFADGSGLSRDNRITTDLLTDLLVRAADPAHPALAAVAGGLPVAGWSGTLATRFREPQVGTGPGAGMVRAKTGTLTGVHSLAGVVSTADGRLLVLAMLADDVPLGMEEARTALDRVAAALAGCGCR